jgi:hypothetical protein
MLTLNAMRNRLAHRLEPKDMTDLLKTFYVAAGPPPTKLDDPGILAALGYGICFVLMMIACLELPEAPTGDH